jgi:hypothetical protein
MNRIEFLFVLALGASISSSNAQVLQHLDSAGQWAESITADDLSRQLHILAADSMEGRETGKPGQRKAAQYIADQFRSMGLQPVNGSYFQDVPLKVSQLKGGVLDLKGTKLLFKDDFVPYPGIEVADVEGDAVFVGYGIQEGEWNDYAGLDVAGKIVVYMTGEPGNAERGYTLSGNQDASRWSRDPSAKRQLADSLGALAVLVVSNEFATLRSRLVPWLSRERMRLDVERKGEGTDLPTLLVSEDMLLRVTGWKSMKDVRKKWTKRKLKGTELGAAKLNLARKDEKVMATNVWGILPGSDSLLSSEIVALTSHYDHVGVDAEGLIYNGADDDGSGTVSLLENAEAWMMAARAGAGPRRTVMFMAFVGEEKGLLGSEWYAENPAFPMEQHVCDLNMDMVGRFDEAHQDDDRYVYLIGSDKLSSELHEISEAVNSNHIGLSLDYTFNAPDDPNRFYYRSDHYNFAKNNVPVIFYFSGVHEDYHGPGDTPDKIRYPKMAEIGRLVFLTSWEVANRDEKLEVDRVNDFPSDR